MSSTATSRSIKVTVPILQGAKNYVPWLLRMRGLLGTTTTSGTCVTAWDITFSLVAPLHAIPMEIISGTPPVITNQAEINAARLAHTDKEQCCTLLESAVVSTLITGVPDTMIHHINQNDANATWELLTQLYSVAGPTAVYVDFLHAVSWCIPNQGNPTTSIAELKGIFHRLASSQALILDAIKSMILLKSAPDGNGALSQSLLANCQLITDLTWDIVCNALQSQWLQCLHSATRAKMSNVQWNQQGKKPFQPGSQGNANPGGSQQKQ
jgi:hypothetical protein